MAPRIVSPAVSATRTAPGRPERRTTLRHLAKRAFIGLGLRAARVKAMNLYYSRLMARQGEWNPSKRIYVPVEAEGALGVNVNKHGFCSGWARRAATRFGKQFHANPDNRVHAWELARLNRSVEKRFEIKAGEVIRSPFTETEIMDCIRGGTIKPGTILGTFLGHSKENRPGRPYSHVVVFQGMHEGKAWFGHNYFGPQSWELHEFFAPKAGGQTFSFLEVMEPAK